MRQMPYKIKQKLRQYANVQNKAKQLSHELGEMFESYAVPEDNLTACANIPLGSDEPQTEALAFLHNGECDNVEQTIKDIEEVFLWFVNNKEGNQ